MPDTPILLGVIGRAHGVRGLLRVTSHTADPADLTSYGPLADAKGRRFLLRWQGVGIAEVSELVDGAAIKVADRNAAEGLTNTRLFIDRAQFPPVQDDDEFYLSDLIGLSAFTPDGLKLGHVAIVHDYGAGTSLEIERDGAAALIVPFTKACVPEVDIASGRVRIVSPDILNAQSGPVDPAGEDGAGDDGAGDDGADDADKGALVDGSLADGSLAGDVPVDAARVAGAPIHADNGSLADGALADGSLADGARVACPPGARSRLRASA